MQNIDINKHNAKRLIYYGELRKQFSKSALTSITWLIWRSFREINFDYGGLSIDGPWTLLWKVKGQGTLTEIGK